MGHLVYGYRIGQNGLVDYRQFDSDRFPDGWVDSPSKLDIPPQPEHDTSAVRQPITTPDGVYGEQRRGGWPKGRPRK